MDLDKDVPSPPPAPIFKETSKKSGSSATNGSSSSKSEKTVTTAKQHNYKERSAGVEEGVIKPKPRGSKPAKSASGKPTTSVASAMASHKRCDPIRSTAAVDCQIMIYYLHFMKMDSQLLCSVEILTMKVVEFSYCACK